MKWKNPHHWLSDYVKRRAASRTVSAWLRIARKLVHGLDANMIQLLFQEEMEKDGYMIYLDDGHGISETSLALFQEHKHLIGKIESIKMTDYGNFEVVYPFKIVGDVGEIWLSGCVAGFAGEGPHTTVQILTELGYPDDACQVVFGNREFLLGPPNKWKPTPLLKNRIPRIAEESAEEVNGNHKGAC